MASSRSSYWNTPLTILDGVAARVNSSENGRIQDNALNDITSLQWQYASEYKITNTLDALRVQITPYLQWIMYIGLSIAVILIIYNGFLMVTDGLHGSGNFEATKKRLINIALGVWLLTGFYVIITLILAIVSYILQ